MKITKTYKTQKIGKLMTPNLYIDKPRSVAIWESIAADLDFNSYGVLKALSQHEVYKFLDIDINETNGHAHVFLNIIPCLSFNFFETMLIESSYLNKTLQHFISRVVDENGHQISLVYDSLVKIAHESFNKFLKSDKATASTINHTYRIPVNIDSEASYEDSKTYKRIKQSNLKRDISHILLHKQAYDRVIEDIKQKLIKYKLVATLNYQTKKKAKGFTRKYDIHKGLRILFSEPVYQEGRRQDICMIATGLLKRYTNLDYDQIAKVIQQYVPRTDEESSKRLDPVKYAKTYTGFLPGYTKFRKLVKEVTGEDVDLTTIQQTTKDGYIIVRRKGITEKSRIFVEEVAQGITILMLVLAYFGQKVTDIDSDTFTVTFNSKSEIAKLLKYMWNKQNGLDSKVINRALKLLRKSDIFEFIHESSRKVSFTISKSNAENLFKRFMIDLDNGDVILYQFYSILKGKNDIEFKPEDEEFRFKSGALLCTLLMFQILSNYEEFRRLFTEAIHDWLLFGQNKLNRYAKFLNAYNEVIRYFKQQKIYKAFNILKIVDIRRFKDLALRYKKTRKKLFYRILFDNVRFILDAIRRFFRSYKI